jgi:hypothetical protein
MESDRERERESGCTLELALEERQERAGEGCRMGRFSVLETFGMSGDVAREEEGEGDVEGGKGEFGKILERKREHISGSLDLNLGIC